jgi:hypothetical protein
MTATGCYKIRIPPELSGIFKLRPELLSLSFRRHKFESPLAGRAPQHRKLLSIVFRSRMRRFHGCSGEKTLRGDCTSEGSWSGSGMSDQS